MDSRVAETEELLKFRARVRVSALCRNYVLYSVPPSYWATVCKTVRPMLLDRCLSCPVVQTKTDVGVLWPKVRWMKMPLGMEEGLGPGHIVLDGDPASPRRDTAPKISGPCLLWLNGWTNQNATWYGRRSRPRRHCVTWGPTAQQPPPHFSAYV